MLVIIERALEGYGRLEEQPSLTSNCGRAHSRLRLLEERTCMTDMSETGTGTDHNPGTETDWQVLGC